MPGIQHFVAMMILPASIAGGGTPGVLGIIEQANRAHLGSATVSEGTTVYEGDRLSTEANGTLQMRCGDVVLLLEGESSVIVRSNASAATEEFYAELVRGAVVLSSSAGVAGEIVVRSARIRPLGTVPGAVQVRILGEKELIIFAKRGPALFSYRGENETIPEGKTYRVILDPSEAGGGASGDQTASKPGAHNKGFILVAVGAAAVVAGVAAWRATRTTRAVESPDHP